MKKFLCVDRIECRYESQPIVDKLSFTIDQGEVACLLGRDCKVTGRQEFSAKITHADWLDQWFNRQVTILPGDGLRVDLRVYMTNKMKRVRHEIEAVHGVIPRTEMMQLQMDDQENA